MPLYGLFVSLIGIYSGESSYPSLYTKPCEKLYLSHASNKSGGPSKDEGYVSHTHNGVQMRSREERRN